MDWARWVNPSISKPTLELRSVRRRDVNGNMMRTWVRNFMAEAGMLAAMTSRCVAIVRLRRDCCSAWRNG